MGKLNQPIHNQDTLTFQELAEELAEIGNPWMSINDMVDQLGLRGKAGNLARIIVNNGYQFIQQQKDHITRYRLKWPDNFR